MLIIVRLTEVNVMDKTKIYLYNAVVIIKEYAEFEDDEKFWDYIEAELGLDEETLNELKSEYERNGWKI